MADEDERLSVAPHKIGMRRKNNVSQFFFFLSFPLLLHHTTTYHIPSHETAVLQTPSHGICDMPEISLNFSRKILHIATLSSLLVHTQYTFMHAKQPFIHTDERGWCLHCRTPTKLLLFLYQYILQHTSVYWWQSSYVQVSAILSFFPISPSPLFSRLSLTPISLTLVQVQHEDAQCHLNTLAVPQH